MNYKPYLIFLTTIFLIQSICAQAVFPDETQPHKWEYVTWFFWGGQCQKKIILNGDKVALCGTEFIEVFDCDENENNCILIGYYRLQNDSVMMRTNQRFWNGTTHIDSVDCSQPEGLMFDFGAPESDTLVCQINSTNPYTLTDFWNVQEQIITYEGIDRQTITMHYRPHPSAPDFLYEMDWIRGIGSTVHPLYSLTCIGDHCEWEQKLTRVFDNGTMIYQDTVLNFSFPCTGWITTSDSPPVAKPTNLTLFPNPVGSSFSIKAERVISQKMNLRIFDLLGRVVVERTNYSIGEMVNVQWLSPGLYHVELANGDSRQLLKLVKG